MSSALVRLTGTFELTPGWQTYPEAVAAQIGGVARSAAAVPVSYRAR